MNIQYRITKDEFYKFFINHISKNRHKKLQLIFYKILCIAALTEFIVILVAGIKNINISVIIQLFIIVGVSIITLPYSTKMNGKLVERLIKSSSKQEFKYICDKDISIFLDENKIIIKRNGNELIDSLESIYITENDGYIYLKVYSMILYIPDRAFNSNTQKNRFSNTIKKYNKNN